MSTSLIEYYFVFSFVNPLIVSITTPVWYYASDNSSDWLQTKTAFPAYGYINFSNTSSGLICVAFANPLPDYVYRSVSYNYINGYSYGDFDFNSDKVITLTKDYVKWMFWPFNSFISVDTVTISIGCVFGFYGNNNPSTYIYQSIIVPGRRGIVP